MDGKQHWITDDLLVQTIKTWQPLSEVTISQDDAREMLASVDQLLDAVGLTAPQNREADI